MGRGAEASGASRGRGAGTAVAGARACEGLKSHSALPAEEAVVVAPQESSAATPLLQRRVDSFMVFQGGPRGQGGLSQPAQHEHSTETTMPDLCQLGYIEDSKRNPKHEYDHEYDMSTTTS